MVNSDFEDNVLIACAHANALDGIVTRDADDFARSGLHVYTPAQLVASIQP